MYHNSKTSSRGVTILTSTKLSLIDSFHDDNGNILLLHIRMNEYNITIGSIYGPNDNDKDLSN
jgi:hypothetical protein